MRKLLTPLFALLLISSPITVLADESRQVDELVIILEGLTGDQIDKVVSQAKEKLLKKTKPEKQITLETLFDAQIATLKNKGVPTQVVRMLANQRDSVLSKAKGMTIGDGNIPFLPIIPRTYLSIYSQMEMVVNDGKKGYNYLKSNLITNVVETPDEPYYIYNVEDGEATLGKSLKDAKKLIKDDGRYALTTVEVISLSLHTDVLSRHFVDASGSRYYSADLVPYVWLYDGRPELYWYYAGSSDSRWGSPSLGSR